MTQRQRVWAWGGVALGALVALGLVVLVVVADLDTAGQVAGIVGTIAGLAALGVSVYALRQPPPAPAPAPAGPTVTAGGPRSVATGGAVAGTVSTGDGPAPASPAPRPPGAHPTGPTPAGPTPPAPAPSGAPPAVPGGATHATGERSVAVGGDLTGTVSTGDTSTADGDRP
ncbi:hypothetical protein [Streptomyces sp. NPDC057702]|uniref:hypothetical protein n=1 Tax=unclassified Streptomyces TaxID=2593676 RepID=UPI0036C1E183